MRRFRTRRHLIEDVNDLTAENRLLRGRIAELLADGVNPQSYTFAEVLDAMDNQYARVAPLVDAIVQQSDHIRNRWQIIAAADRLEQIVDTLRLYEAPTAAVAVTPPEQDEES